MACKGCDEKESRYGGAKIMSNGDVDRDAYQQKGSMAQQQPQDPMSAFFSAKQFTYEELKERQDFTRSAARQQADHIMSEMTDAMRQIHLEELIATANSDMMSIPGMNADQAIVAIKDALDRESFAFVETLYPGLRELVEARYEALAAQFLPGRKLG